MTIDVPGTLAECQERPLKLVKTPAPETPAEAPQSNRPESRRRREQMRAALTDERTREAYRIAVRHSAYVAGGMRIVTRRIWEERTTARYGRMMRAAEAVGNLDEAKEWEERAHRFRHARHQRRMDMLSGMRQAPRAVGAAILTGAGLLTASGIALAVANENVSDMLVPFQLFLEAVDWAFFIGAVVWGAAKLVGPALGLIALWNVGRKRQTAPRWALPEQARGEGDPITPSIVVVAFRDLGISTLRKSIVDMEDAGASMLSVISPAGCGVEVDVHLPSGVDTSEIQKRRRKLAENLGRHEHELYITLAPQPRTVRLWIADSGALDEPVPASPLVTDQELTADYTNGRAPWGLNLRGDAVLVTLYQKHLLVTGLSNQGKTAALRALALWLCLDPSVEFRIADLKGHGDWAMFYGLATILIEGPTDDHVMEATHVVEDAVDEMIRRLAAPKGTVFPPLIIIVDEAQVAYGSGARETYVAENGTVKYGAPYGGQKATSRYFQAVKKIHDQGRAVNVTIWEGTQDPTDQNLPKRSREGNHLRASLVLGTEAQAKMALGDAPVVKGAAPHKLRQDVDKGQLVVAGSGIDMAKGQVSENVRTHYIDDDEAVAITDRAKALRRRVTTLGKLAVVEDIDQLADIRVVLGNERRVRTQEVLSRLYVLNKAAYGEWTFQDLKEVLDEVDATPHKSDGQMVVDRQKVERALAGRDSSDQGSAREAGSSP
jgi:S-DNA-T family DNA segregation ATPase FtsK/SpoIIIE